MSEPHNSVEQRYTIISSDCHAGGNMAAYEEYLDPAWRDEFNEWRGAYRNPYRDLQDDGRSRNWDDDRRLSEQYADGIVAEITFPNTVPPFYPTGALIARPPKDRADYERRFAGIRAHNRWLRDWCSRYPRPAPRPAPGLRRRPRRRGGHPRVGRRRGVPQLPAAPHPARQRPARLLGSALGPAVGGGGRPRPDHDPPRRQRRARLRQGARGRGDLLDGGAVLLAPQPGPPDHVGGVRALPDAALRHDRAGRGLAGGGVAPDGRLPPPDAPRPGRRAGLRDRHRAAHEAVGVLRPQRVDRGQLPVSGRGGRHPHRRGAQGDVGQRLPPPRGHIPLLAGKPPAGLQRLGRGRHEGHTGRQRGRDVRLRPRPAGPAGRRARPHHRAGGHPAGKDPGQGHHPAFFKP